MASFTESNENENLTIFHQKETYMNGLVETVKNLGNNEDLTLATSLKILKENDFNKFKGGKIEEGDISQYGI